MSSFTVNFGSLSENETSTLRSFAPVLGLQGSIDCKEVIHMSHDDPGKENNDKVAEIAAIEERLQVLRVEHRALDLSLQEIEKHLSLTSQEQQEVARIKKQKLHKKDEISHIETLLAQLKQQNPANS
ncbi:MAG: hypothetical protein CVU65_10160 [Deltaproteobacteria bacterium HGW-Deltaproteobacteria-22]|nr:MAG: hypothetical protein CVU65_10160 [Deltaproteobacteria bacterium HGW-Deltaproteobacteria-22]